ncbi:MAG: hypothetical protein RQ847_06615, partial [Wenzhouxiangellaceae bacterium]|nr:hypothetical protein [Wenzhouxiangellaceae bacterium]
MRTKFAGLATALLVAATASAGGGDVEAGRMLYQHGVLASGEALAGEGFGGVELKSEYAACVRCHRRSGFGSYEGGYYIPPITQPYLFGGRQISRDDRFRALFMQAQSAEFRHQVRRVRDRAPYTSETLARVLREGIDPEGRELERLMPRYSLSDADLANLEAYLRTLSAEISPGVGEQYVHLATVVHRDVPEDRREAMIGTMASFVDWYNKRTLGDLQLAGHSVYGSSLYTRYSRLYRLSVWEIEGPEETWREQLQAHYARQPVFAMISGQVVGRWDEIARYADAAGLPTIFPITELPGEIGPLGGYTVYFNAGRLLEAELLCERVIASAPARVLQLVDRTVEARASAAHFEQTAARKQAEIGLSTRSIDDWQVPPEGGGESVRADVLVVWTDDPDAELLRQWQDATGATEVLMPAAAIESLAGTAEASEAPGNWLFSYPFALQQIYYPERFRARAWMNTRGLDFAESDVQLRAYYAMLMFRDSFVHLLDHYNREFLLEVLEHQIQGSPNPGLYPEMELAP